MSDRCRAWCITINNPTEEDRAGFAALAATCVYACYGNETGEKGTPHMQGYAYAKNAIRRPTLLKHIPRASLIVARGSAEQNRDYCKKDGDFIEWGKLPATPSQKGSAGADYWTDILEKAKRGALDEIDSKVQITHQFALQKIAAQYAPLPADNDEILNYWFWGPTGTGKSKKARADFPGAYLKNCNKWWDGYRGEDYVLIEDFDKAHHVLGHFVKIWGDRYSFRAEAKNSHIVARPKTIVITSNYSPEEIWGSDPGNLEPILRRYKVVHFDKL